MLVVTMATQMTVNEMYSISFEFEGHLNTETKEGLYMTSYVDYTGIERFVFLDTLLKILDKMKQL